MKNKFVITLFFCAAGLTLNAQNATPNSEHRAKNTIQSIRKAYGEVQEHIARMTPNEEGYTQEPKEFYELNIDQNLPATGGHHERVLMYYGELSTLDEVIYKPHYLQFATAKYNFAAREFYEEYLYNDKGQLLFIFATTPDVIIGQTEVYELRLWYDGKRLLRFTARSNGEESFTGADIPPLFKDEVNRLKYRAEKMKTLFKNIDDNTYL